MTLMISDLPHDLVEKILSRVPAIPLKRLRPTCKQWKALSKDGGFAEKHHRKAPKQPLRLMLKEFRVCPMNVEIDDAPSVEFKEDALDLKVDIAEVFHCQGLLLCTTRCNRLVVSNPCLGETIWIKSKTGNYSYKKHSRFALGYQNKSKSSPSSYKILRFWDNRNLKQPIVEYEMYEFSTGSWRVLGDIDQDCNIHRIGCSLSLKGNTYWVASDRKGVESLFLLCFDFTRERFIRLNLAPVSPCVVVLSLVREEEEEQQQLSALHQNFLESKMELWVTNNKFDSDTETTLLWTKSFTVDLSNFDLRFPFFVTFSLDEEKKVAVYCRSADWYCENMVHIIGEDKENCTQVPFVKSTDKSWRPFIFNYVPSLVQIQQGAVTQQRE